MTEFIIEVVRVGPIIKHPNADTLGLTKVYEYPTTIKLGQIVEGDLGVYIPIDSIVPTDLPEFKFLEGHPRIKARKYRGIFSMGLLIKAPIPTWVVGRDVQVELGITKWEPPEFTVGGDNEHCPFNFPHYTDIAGYRRWADVLQEGEEVVITEKIHGCNARYAWHQDRFWAGSRTSMKRADDPKGLYQNLFWKAARQNQLDDKLKAIPGIAVYGEVFGSNQDIKYDMPGGHHGFRVFDMVRLADGAFLDWDEVVSNAAELGLDLVPILYRGAWSKDLTKLANGNSTFAKNVREGCVVHPVKERLAEYAGALGRVIFKVIGEEYMLL
jgi:RNA ligase (TIGR02306 family)